MRKLIRYDLVSSLSDHFDITLLLATKDRHRYTFLARQQTLKCSQQSSRAAIGQQTYFQQQSQTPPLPSRNITHGLERHVARDTPIMIFGSIGATDNRQFVEVTARIHAKAPYSRGETHSGNASAAVSLVPPNILFRRCCGSCSVNLR